MRRRIKRPSPALLVSFAAMAVAIGGTAVIAQGSGSGPPKGNVVGYAQVSLNGDVSSKGSLNVKNSNVSPDDTAGIYCFRGLPFKFRGLQATVNYASSSTISPHTQVARKYSGGDCPGADALVAISGNSDYQSSGFFVVFYK
jgi:hypothetical protein